MDDKTLTCKQRTKIVELAECLARDLNEVGLMRYIAFNEDKATKEVRMGRSSQLYRMYVLAGQMALSIRQGTA